MSAGQARHEHARGAHGVRRRRRDPRGADRPRAGRRRLPDALAGRHLRRRSGCCSPARTASRRRRGRRRRCSPTPRAAPPTADRGRSSRWRARSCSTSRRGGWHRPRRAAPPQLPRPRRPARTSNPTGMPYDHMSPREVFEAALERLDYDAFRREQAGGARAGSLPRRRHLQLRRADERPAWATSAPRARRSASSRRAR